MIIEVIGYAALFAGSAAIGFSVPYTISAYKRYRGRKKFEGFISNMVEQIAAKQKEINEKTVSQARQVSEFTFRDKERNLQTVKIIIDPGINPDKISDEEKEGLSVMEFSRKGPIDGLPEEIKQVKEFVFSAKSVEDMRKAGIEPEDMVAKMLKASGRME